MAIIRTIIWFVYFFGRPITIIPQMLKAKKLKEQGDEEGALQIANKWVPIWTNGLLKLAGVTITVRGMENIPTDRAVVFTPNHQSNYDIPLMLTKLGRLYPIVAKIETLKIPLIRTWMKNFNCVFLDRENPRQAVGAMREAANLLKSGTSIVVFPEGTRSKGNKMGEFKSGAFKMAFNAKAAIVPIVIDGSYLAMEANGNLMKPAHITMTILPPVETASLDKAQQRAMPDQIASLIASYLPEGENYSK